MNALNIDYDCSPINVAVRRRQHLCRTLQAMETEIQKLRSEIFGSLVQPGQTLVDGFPVIDMLASDTHYIVLIELPGVAPADLDLSLNDGILTLKGVKHMARIDDDHACLHVESNSGPFHRSISLPDDADDRNPTAIFSHGIVSVRLDRRRNPI